MEESPYLKASASLRQKFEALPLIGALPKAEQRLVIESSKIRRYSADEMIIYEGIYDAWVYILIQGEVRIEKAGQPLATLDRSGDLFGELCLIDRKTRSASAQAISDCVCLAIDTLQLKAPTGSDALMAVVYRLIAELLATRLRHTNEELVYLKQELNWQRGRKI
ncbi:MAG TPA: cyclic nucleotide-binding domain-containing protein [Motiliproteus sp.]